MILKKKAELHLIDIWGDQLQSDILISPHHGSKTSSSEQFLTVVKPKWVVISSGYKNRFNHPAKAVVTRYQEHKIKTLNTNCTGQIDIQIGSNISFIPYRAAHKRYYQRTCP